MDTLRNVLIALAGLGLALQTVSLVRGWSRARRWARGIEMARPEVARWAESRGWSAAHGAEVVRSVLDPLAGCRGRVGATLRRPRVGAVLASGAGGRALLAQICERRGDGPPLVILEASLGCPVPEIFRDPAIDVRLPWVEASFDALPEHLGERTSAHAFESADPADAARDLRVEPPVRIRFADGRVGIACEGLLSPGLADRLLVARDRIEARMKEVGG